MKLRLRSFLLRLLSRTPTNPLIPPLQKDLSEYAGGDYSSPRPDITIAMQCVEDPFYYALLTSLTIDLRKLSGAKARFILVRSISGAVGRNVRASISRSTIATFIQTSRWARIARPLVGEVAYRSKSFSHIPGDIIDLFRATIVWSHLTSAEDCEKLHLEGLHVGDLIVDSYIRFRPSARFDHKDPFLISVIWQAFRDVRRARRFFLRQRPNLYLTSHSTYLEHGIPVRAALEADCAVYSFGSLAVFGKRLTHDDFFHTPEATRYKATFASLAEQQLRRQEAESALKSRLAGNTDGATSYMRSSAYQQNNEMVPDIEGCIVVFLHDFYDSPHVYPELVFPDFWRWACFTIETLRSAGIPFWLKPHPNQIQLSSTALQELQASYPDARILSPRITTVQLAEAGMICGVTVYGTVAHELAYLGIPSIGCSLHPHNSFGFCRTAKTPEEYRQLLKSAHTQPMSRVDMRQEALDFYYMHNLYNRDDQVQLRAGFVATWKAAHSTGDSAAGETLRQMRVFRASNAYRSFVTALAATHLRSPNDARNFERASS